ncbi:MAG: site-specific integrase, partial [Gammaproteobacteria bacterium]|nr:site-specific integrase [Gammaproteobacteria bacterium]
SQAPAADPRGTLGASLGRTYELHWSRSRSATVMARVVSLLQREVGTLPLAEVRTKAMRERCEKWLSAGLSPATVNRRMSAIGVALTRAVEDGDLQSRPKLPHFTENNVKERYMTPEEEAAVLAWLDRKVASDQFFDAGEWAYIRNLTVFLLDTGFRYSESLKFAVVDGHASLNGTETKSGKGRRVPLTPRAKAAADGLLGSLWHAKLQTMDNAWDWVSHRWKQVAAGGGCPDVTLHILRHTLASRLVQRGVPIYTVSRWLGHSSVKVTERYAKLAPDSLSQALSALSGGPVPVEAALQKRNDTSGDSTLPDVSQYNSASN